MSFVLSPSARFARLFDLDGHQALLEIRPSLNPDKRAVGLPDAVFIVDLGWCRAASLVDPAWVQKLSSPTDGMNARLLESFTEDQARNYRNQLLFDYGDSAAFAQTHVARRNEHGELLNAAEVAAFERETAPKPFAKLFLSGEQQILVTFSGTFSGVESDHGRGLYVRIHDDPAFPLALSSPHADYAAFEAFDDTDAQAAWQRATHPASRTQPKL